MKIPLQVPKQGVPQKLPVDYFNLVGEYILPTPKKPEPKNPIKKPVRRA